MLGKKIKVKLSELNHVPYERMHADRYDKDSERWKELKESLECGYKPEQYTDGYIKTNRKGRVLDGNHRVYILKGIYGDDTEITVYRMNIFFLYFIYPLMFLISIPMNILKAFNISVTIKGKVYTIWDMLCNLVTKPIVLLMYMDMWSRSKIIRVKKIISFNKNNPYKHHEK